MNRFSRIALLALAGWGMPCVVAAQTAAAPSVTTPVERDKMAIEQMAAGRGGRSVMAPVETRITTGKPYSAEAVTESLQVLGDGNRISKKSVTRVYRDTEGRTRREQFDADGTARTITISDPVGQVSYTLNPQTKTGFQSSIVSLRSVNVITPSGGFARGGGGGTGTGEAVARGGGGGGGRGGAAVAETKPENVERTRAKVEEARVAIVEQAATSNAAATQAKQVLELAASGGGQTTRENLAEQVIEGVRATGTRSTTVIPAGAIGNMNEIKVVSEQWFSPDLDVLVLTKHTDPRVGETIYRLTNIVRAQPDPNLFVAPADYTIKGRTVRNDQ